MAECAFGITGSDYVIMASDKTAGRSIIKMGETSKLRKLGSHLGMAFGGESGDTTNFADYISRNMRLYQIRNDIELTPQAAAAFTRRTLAESIRSRKPYVVNVLMAGIDTTSGKPHLYTMDPYGTLAKTDYSAQGLGIYVSLSTMDRYWRPDLTQEEAIGLMKRCINEVQIRLSYAFDFNAIIIDKDGYREVAL